MPKYEAMCELPAHDGGNIPKGTIIERDIASAAHWEERGLLKRVKAGKSAKAGSAAKADKAEAGAEPAADAKSGQPAKSSAKPL